METVLLSAWLYFSVSSVNLIAHLLQETLTVSDVYPQDPFLYCIATPRPQNGHGFKSSSITLSLHSKKQNDRGTPPRSYRHDQPALDLPAGRCQAADLAFFLGITHSLKHVLR